MTINLFLQAMFTGELVESHQTEIVIRDIEERAMELLIEFSYSSHIVVEEGNVQSLLPAACLLQMGEIQGMYSLSMFLSLGKTRGIVIICVKHCRGVASFLQRLWFEITK